MSSTDRATPLPRSPELKQMMSSLSSISETLLSSYETLAKRAQRVEQELIRTNAKLSEKVAELDATTRDLEAILQALPSGVVVSDECGKVMRVNDRALNILQCVAEEIIGQSHHDGLLGKAASGERRKYVGPDESQIVLASRYSEILGDDGGLKGSVEILDDQTELESLSERVHCMDKMAALGTMAAGIAHEIRNPMNAIKGFADLLKRGAEEGSREARWMSLISSGVSEIDAIITSMLTFAEPERLRRETVEANELVDAAISAALCSIPDGERRERWEIRSECSAEPFAADRIKLRQAVRNLIANAISVQPEGGGVEVSVHREDEEIVIRVEDSGPGIPDEFLNRVTDPFFTTRAEGTGLGLALVHTIAQLHGGRFEIHSKAAPTTGACATIRIPHPHNH